VAGSVKTWTLGKEKIESTGKMNYYEIVMKRECSTLAFI